MLFLSAQKRNLGENIFVWGNEIAENSYSNIPAIATDSGAYHFALLRMTAQPKSPATVSQKEKRRLVDGATFQGKA